MASTNPDGTPKVPDTGTGGQGGTMTPPTATGPVVPPPPSVCATAAPEPGPSPLRRLTHTEYDNTVRDLLTTTATPARTFVAEERSLGFDNGATVRTVSQLLAEQYANAARQLSQAAGTNLAGTLGCDPAVTSEDACASSFIDSFGLRSYRRPLSVNEKARLNAFYQASKAEYGFPAAVEMLVQALLQTPQFLYRMEVADTTGPAVAQAPGVVQAGPYELASRLSYLFWQSMPDATLLAAAQTGELATPAQVVAQARRLLLDPRAKSAVVNFHSQWFELGPVDHISKDATVVSNFTPELGPLLRQQAEAFVASTVFDGAGTLGALLTSPAGFVNDTLAPLYGVAAPGSATLSPIMLPSTERAGLLTQAAWLALNAKPDQSSPVKRGYFVRSELLCNTPPPPPPALNVMVPAFDPNVSTRQRFEAHRTDPACASCHQLMDPIGLGFEHYDALGGYRVAEANAPVDAKGELTNTDINGVFNGAIELGQKLSSSAQVQNCAVSHWFHFGFGRAETQADGCTLGKMQEAFSKTNGDIRELMVTMSQSDAFLYRSASQGGAL
ncbi:MAG: DUF1592 domain-containing protein [Polyangiaceae bacterium]|nr:DUF1592 domain-containing protein [Polyangiaceae bacterium]